MKRWSAWLATLALILALVACGGDDDNAGADDDGNGGDAAPLIEMLASVPDTGEAREYLRFTDYALYRELGDVGGPGGDSASDVDEWAVAAFQNARDVVPGMSFPAFFSSLYTENAALRTEFGFDISDLDQVLEAGAPPSVYNVFRGRFDEGGIDDAVHSDPSFSGILEEAEYSGVPYYSWGEDFEQDFNRSTPVRRLGVGGRLALLDGDIYFCNWTEGIEGMIDAGTVLQPSLADSSFGLMANALAPMQPYSVVMTSHPQIEDLISQVEVEPKLLPYQAYATAGGIDADGPFLAIAVANADEAAASQNATRLQERLLNASQRNVRWAQFIDEVEVSIQGTVSVAKVRGSSLPYDLADRGDGVLISE